MKALPIRSLTCILVTLVTCYLELYAQHLPAFTGAFDQSSISRIDLNLPADSVIAMYQAGDDTDGFTATFSYDGSTNDTLNLLVRIRLRGNTSLMAYKKSYRINFDGVDPSQEWQGLEKLNLIGLQNDPSLLRSKLCHDAFRQAGVFSAQTAFTRLYINGEYMGVYQIQEHLDEEFCKLYFDQQGDGNLYKCTYPATLAYLGTNPDLYKFANWGTRHYDLKTNEWRDDYSDLARLIAVINTTAVSNLPCELPKVFDVHTYLKTMAIDVLTGNWDNYIYNKNNFYLYHHQLSDQFVYMPYDLDNTLGIDWVNIDWAARDPYTWQPSDDDRPLFERILLVPEYRQLFTNYLVEYAQTFLSATEVAAAASAWQSMIEEAALEDDYRTVDFGFDDNAFLEAITSAWGGHVDYGIATFANTRAEFISFQADPVTTIPTRVHWLNHPVITGENNTTVTIMAFIEPSSEIDFELQISTDNTTFTPMSLFNDAGANGDDVAGDGLYTAQFENTFASDQLYYRLTMSDGTTFPCAAKMMWLTSPTTGIMINEVMTQNSTVWSDESGEFDDWVELYNSSENDINLSGYFLTDDIENPNAFPLPAVTLNAGEFLIVWLDNDMEQGPLHATFGMGSSNNFLWLLRTQTGTLRIQDGFSPCLSGPDQSVERLIDGGQEVASTLDPTPGYSNVTSIAETTEPRIVVFPNPARTSLHLSERVEACTILDMTGRVVSNHKQVQSLPIEHLSPGHYFLRLPNGSTQTFTKVN